MRISSYPKVIWLLAIGMTINVTGNSFLWPLNTIYITEILGKSMSIAGIVLMLQQGVGIIGNLIGGWLFDIHGGKRTIIIGVSMSIVIVVGLSFTTNFLMYVILMQLLGFSNGLVFPSMYAMAGAVWPEGGRRAFNTIYVSQNFGVAVGSTLGGIIAQVSFTYIFLVNALTFAIFLLLILFGFKKEHWQMARINAPQNRSGIFDTSKTRLQLNRFLPLLIISFAFILTWIPYVQWQTSLSKYMKTLGIPLSKYTILWTINGGLIVLGQPIISLLTRRLLNTSKKQMLSGVFIFFIAYIILFRNTYYSGFVLAMVVMTFAEMLVWPAVPAAAADLAPEGKKGFYQGIISSSGAAGRMLGFLLGGLLYDLTTINNMILIMLTLFVLSGFAFLNYDRRIKRNIEQVNAYD